MDRFWAFVWDGVPYEVIRSEVRDGRSLSVIQLFFSGISSVRDISKPCFCELASLLWGQLAMFSERCSAASAGTVAVLDDVGFGAGLRDTQSKARNLIIPKDDLVLGAIWIRTFCLIN